MSDNLLSLRGRVVVVTGGAGGGIGTTVTRMVAQAGATVIAVGRCRDNLDRHITPLSAQGLSIVPVVADVATDDGVAAALEQARRTHDGDLYGLVNVVGGAAPPTWMPSTRVTRSDWRDLFTQNLETAFFMSQGIAAELKAQKRPGSIVSISSVSGINSAPFHIAYGTAKAAVVAMTRTMAVELAPDDIRVNAVAPGVTETPASRTYVDDDSERDRRAIAIGRRGRPDEVAGVILFLLSDLSSYITGQTLLVDGGLSLKFSHLAADNTPLFLRDESFRAAITRWEAP